MSPSDIIPHLVLGPLILALALIFRAFPPKKINALYGYRTRRSMQSKEAWNASNEYSSELMIWVGIGTIIIQIAFYFLFSPVVALLSAVGFMTIGLVVMIIMVEGHLDRNFDDEGNKKQN